ncbi:hypothetical protein ACHAWC_007161, partial [Mediolabrus comicus]
MLLLSFLSNLFHCSGHQIILYSTKREIGYHFLLTRAPTIPPASVEGAALA